MFHLYVTLSMPCKFSLLMTLQLSYYCYFGIILPISIVLHTFHIFLCVYKNKHILILKKTIETYMTF